MGKISAVAKQRYSDKVKKYKAEIEQMLVRERSIVSTIHDGSADSGFKRLGLAEERLNLASRYLLLNRVSVALLGVRGEAFLNDARKSCYQSVIFLEDVVSDLIDAGYSEYSEKLESIESVPDDARYKLARKLGFTIEAVEQSFGDNSKWKWSFVELEGRFATVSKNLLNMKTLIAGLDPRSEHYDERLAHLAMVKRLLQRAADRYRERYELSTLRLDDFKLAIAHLAALRRLHLLLGESDSAETLKKRIEVWKQKMESDDKRESSHKR
ncbi:MAG: hypothetical protein ACLFNQ_05725 [Spirochaetaceae bacterium]